MKTVWFVFFARFILVSVCLDYLEGWNYINLHCRDNDKDPVDWWYIYKPPSESFQFMLNGPNFSYITSERAGRWQASKQPLTAHSMLQHTLAPLYRITYSDQLAYLTYEDWHPGGSRPGSEMKGVLMSDELGGVWIMHTLSNFPDITKRTAQVPDKESPFGHMIACFALDLETINRFVEVLKLASPKIKSIHIPSGMKSYLSSWNNLNKPSRRSKRVSGDTSIDILTRDKTLRLAVRVRRPGDGHCLYTNFAKEKLIVLDVYGHMQKLNSRLCQDEYSVRAIESISLKLDESVSYIPKGATDRSRFAVSTAAHWQKLGHSTPQYWSCISTLDEGDDTRRGGVLACADSFKVWSTFDNLKVKEPQC